MKQKNQAKNFSELPKGVQIAIGIIAIIIIVPIVVAITGNKSQNKQIDEAIVKCVLMEEADIVNVAGEEWSDNVVKKAEKHCESGHETAEKEKQFIEIIQSDWEERKTEILNGSTLEQIFQKTAK